MADYFPIDRVKTNLRWDLRRPGNRDKAKGIVSEVPFCIFPLCIILGEP